MVVVDEGGVDLDADLDDHNAEAEADDADDGDAVVAAAGPAGRVSTVKQSCIRSYEDVEGLSLCSPRPSSSVSTTLPVLLCVFGPCSS